MPSGNKFDITLVTDTGNVLVSMTGFMSLPAKGISALQSMQTLAPGADSLIGNTTLYKEIWAPFKALTSSPSTEAKAIVFTTNENWLSSIYSDAELVVLPSAQDNKLATIANQYTHSAKVLMQSLAKISVKGGQPTVVQVLVCLLYTSPSPRDRG